MTTNFKARLLQHFINKKEEGGFTLIELLVVIIIIGILAAIALPSFLSQANRARQTEADNFIGSINRGQQAYRLENPTFANDFTKLEVTVGTAVSATRRNGEFFIYDLATAAATLGTRADITASAKDPSLLGARGCVKVEVATGTTSAAIGRATAAGTAVPAVTVCGTGW